MFYYQFNTEGFVTAMVRSKTAPEGVDYFASDTMLSMGRMKLDKETEEVVYYKYSASEEDTNIPRIKIATKDINIRE